MRCIKFIFAILLFYQAGFCQDDKTANIQVLTKVTFKETLLPDYNVFLFYDSHTKDSLAITDYSPKHFSLSPNKLYTIYYKKKDVAGKYILIDTKLPTKIAARKFRILIHIELDPESSKQKINTDDFPSAIIKYDLKSRNFEYVKDYHKQIHR